MNTKTYPKWVGPILGLMLAGSAHYLSGSKKSGLWWFGILLATGMTATVLLVTPGNISLLSAAALLFVYVVLWISMLVSSYRPVAKLSPLSWLIFFLLFIAVPTTFNALATQIARPYRVPSATMSPTIMPGDCIIVSPIAYNLRRPERGDVIVFSTENVNHSDINTNSLFVKRIAGLPGETIMIDSPHLVIDGEPVTQPSIYSEISARDGGFKPAPDFMRDRALLVWQTDKITLADNEYLPLGDDPKRSLDGRFYGAIKDEDIIGRACRIYWPLKRIRDL